MKIHGLRPELQPTAVNEKIRVEKEANKEEEKLNLKTKIKLNSSRLLDIKG